MCLCSVSYGHLAIYCRRTYRRFAFTPRPLPFLALLLVSLLFPILLTNSLSHIPLSRSILLSSSSSPPLLLRVGAGRTR